MTGDLRIIKNNALRKRFIKGPKYRQVRPINLENAKRCVLEGLHNCISSWYYKNGVGKSFFLGWTNNVKIKIDERISLLTNKLYTNKHMDCLSSPDVKNALDNIHKDFVVVPIDKASGNIALVRKRFYASVITRELGLNNNSSTDTYKNTGGLSANDITDGNIRDLKIKFGIDNIPIENHQLPNMYWMPKMHKNPIKARFIIVSPKSSIKTLARTITSVFRLFFRQIQTYNDKCRIFTGVNTFWVVQNNKPVTDANLGLIGLNKRRKATSVSTFDFSTLYTKLPHNKLLMALNSLIDFCFDGGECKYVTVNNYGARWVNNIKDNVICLNNKGCSCLSTS